MSLIVASLVVAVPASAAGDPTRVTTPRTAVGYNGHAGLVKGSATQVGRNVVKAVSLWVYKPGGSSAYKHGTGGISLAYGSYTASTHVAYQVNNAGSYGYFVSKRYPLRVINGGWRFSGSGSGNTANARILYTYWKVAYTFDCSSFGQSGNFILDAIRPYNGDDFGLANRLDRSGSGTGYVREAGTFYFDVISECDWTLRVTKA